MMLETRRWIGLCWLVLACWSASAGAAAPVEGFAPVEGGRHTWLSNPLLERTPKPPTAERLAEIRVPTLLILGSLDVPYIQKVIALMEKSIPGAKKVVIEGSGHMVNMEKPEEHDRAVLGFLASLPKGSAGFTAGIQKQAAAEGYLPATDGVHLHSQKVGSGPETLVFLDGRWPEGAEAIPG